MTLPRAESYWSTADRVPHPFYDLVRKKGEVAWDEEMKAWLVVGAAAVRSVLMNEDVFKHPYTSMKAGEGYKALRLDNPRSFQFLIGEEHRAMHRWWLKDLLSPKWVASYHETIVVPVVANILAGLDGRNTFDLVDDFAEKVPVGVFAELMDLPDRSPSSLAKIKSLNDRIAEFASAANSLKLETQDPGEATSIQERAIAAARELNDMLRPLVRERKGSNGQDFISRLWQGGSTIFPDWNEIDTLDSCRRLLFAGSDTTTIAIENAFYMLLTDFQLMKEVRGGGKAMMPSFAEEVLRLNGSVQFRPRRAAGDTELAGEKIKAGDMVLAIIQAANRDEKAFACPHAVNLQRPNPRTHFAFSVGGRSCPGSNLARDELREAVWQVLERYPNIELEDPGEPSLKGFLFRSYRPLNVRVQPN